MFKLSDVVEVPTVEAGGGSLDIVRGRSRMTIDPRIPTTRCREGVRPVFTDQEDIARAKREAKREEEFGVSHER